MRTALVTLVLVAVIGGGCGGDTYWVSVNFPNQSALTAAAWLKLFVIEPGVPEANCTSLLIGHVAPGDTNYQVGDSFQVDPRSHGENDGRLHVGKGGRRFFFAEATDSSMNPLLRGCVEIQVGVTESKEISIALGPIPGSPCPLDGINLSAEDCPSSLECLGLTSPNRTIACSSSSQCFDYYSGILNPDCGNDDSLCGYSYCSAPCDAGECPTGFSPIDVFQLGCYCRPDPTI